MFHLFRAVIDRVKILLATSAALELEADALARHARHKAELLRLAGQYEDEKLHGVAQEFRQHALALDLHQPLSGITKALASWQGPDAARTLPAPAGPQPETTESPARGRRKTR